MKNTVVEAFAREVKRTAEDAIRNFKKMVNNKHYVLDDAVREVKFIDSKITIVTWADGHTTKVTDTGNNTWEETAIATAIAKEALGNAGLAGEIRRLLQSNRVKVITSKTEKPIQEEIKAPVAEKAEVFEEKRVEVHLSSVREIFEQFEDILDKAMTKADIDEFTIYNDGDDMSDLYFEIRDEDDCVDRQIVKINLTSEIKNLIKESTSEKDAEKAILDYLKNTVLEDIITKIQDYKKEHYSDEEEEERIAEREEEVDDFEDTPVVETPAPAPTSDNTKTAKRNSKGNWEVRTKEIRMERKDKDALIRDMRAKGYEIIFK